MCIASTSVNLCTLANPAAADTMQHMSAAAASTLLGQSVIVMAKRLPGLTPGSLIKGYVPMFLLVLHNKVSS